MNKLVGVAILCLSGLFSLNALAELSPPKGTVDSRIRVAPYSAEEVYRLQGIVGYQIDLQFESGETFVGLGAGDIDGLSFVGQDNHLFLKPKAPRVATNLTVLTNRRHYQLDYSSVPSSKISQAEVIYAVRFAYLPPVPLADNSAAEIISTELREASAKRLQNSDYWFCGSSAIRPIAASDDGVHTRLRFSANADLPAIFVRNDDGESLLNFSMDDGDVVVHRLASRFVLRRGKQTGCIVNRGYVGAGVRLKSGTIAPEVERKSHRVSHE